ncbi:hypothetical protein IMZ16_04545 [Cruoricaptor ignavus]|uniref:DUF8201 domain-containing protein n=1 Tax=Cruoricaptor ignavus TaxID=1118202 RepID=A0A7M1T6I4_9FLAO|nr:hypothetical protein [Cruoricaptor ignavus]QOR74704.1 hypothetical protein IMZ16_04545 [Cruoricaptor ignavus]
MLSIFCTLIVLLAAISGFGTLFLNLFRIYEDGLAEKLIGGIFSITMIFTLLTFFLPLNFWVEILTVIIGISAFFFFRIYENFIVFFKNNSKSAILILISVFAVSFPPFILDHFGYYVPSILWLREIGLVKGISNLDLVLGQMSFWHIFQAGFSNFTDTALKINILPLVIFIIYCYEKRQNLPLIFLPILFLFSQSPSPDLPVLAFSIILLVEILNGNKNLKWLFALSVFIFAIKPTMIWPPILVILYGIAILKNFRIGSLGIFVMIIFITKNIFCFGYPIFPLTYFDLNLPWKPNPEVMKISENIAVQKTYDMQYSAEEIANFTFGERISNWFFLPGIKAVIHWLFAISLFFFTIFTFRKNNTLIKIIYFSLIIKCILVLITSAQYRFFIDVFFVIITVIFYEKSKLKIWKKLAFGGSLVVLFFLSYPKILNQMVPSFRLSAMMRGFKTEQLWIPKVYNAVQFETHQIGNLKFNFSANYPLSYSTPVPAISPDRFIEYRDAKIFPQLIDNQNIRSGFYHEKLGKKDLKKLNQIISRQMEEMQKNSRQNAGNNQ